MRDNHIWIQRIAARIQVFALVTALALLLGSAGWLLGGAEMALAAFIAVVGLYWLQPLMAPHLILKIRGGRPLSTQEAPVLHEMVRVLSRQAGLDHTPRLYFLPGEVMNAFTVGSGRHARVGFTQALLHLSRDEVAGVLAHEIAHIRNQDTRVMGFAALLSQLIQGMALIGQLLLILNLPLILAGHNIISLGGILLLILAPYAGLLIQLALSRSREYLADLEAAALLGSPQPLASALTAIERHNHERRRRLRLRWPGARPADNVMLRTHPPTRERIRRLLAIESAQMYLAAQDQPSLAWSDRYDRFSANARMARCRAYGLCP